MSNGLIPPWKKKACDRIVVAWADTAGEHWHELTDEGKKAVLVLEDSFAADMKAIFEKHWRAPAG